MKHVNRVLLLPAYLAEDAVLAHLIEAAKDCDTGGDIVTAPFIKAATQELVDRGSPHAPVMTAEEAIAEIEATIASMNDDDCNTCAPIMAVIERFYSKTAPPKPTDPYEIAARAAGWLQGGDDDGVIYDGKVFGSWKEAVSWAGNEEAGVAMWADSTVYASWKECCEGEDLEVEA